MRRNCFEDPLIIRWKAKRIHRNAIKRDLDLEEFIHCCIRFNIRLCCCILVNGKRRLKAGLTKVWRSFFETGFKAGISSKHADQLTELLLTWDSITEYNSFVILVIASITYQEIDKVPGLWLSLEDGASPLNFEWVMPILQIKRTIINVKNVQSAPSGTYR